MMLPLAILAAAFCALLYWRVDRKGSRTYGSARFASVWMLFRNKLFKARGLWIGEWIRQLDVYFDGTHALTFGASGSGKGTCAILPNLLRHSRMFVVDPGGENTAVAIKHWRREGYALSIINPFAMYGEHPYDLPVHGFNPLDLLDPASASFAADAKVLAEMLTPRLGNEGMNGSYFKDSSERIKMALLIHIKTTQPPEKQNLTRLYELVNMDTDGWTDLVEALRENDACDGLVRNEANTLTRIETQAPEEFSAIYSTLQQDLSWLADPQVRENMKRSDVDFGVLKDASKRGAVISVVMPLEYIETHAAITRLAMACTILTMQRRPQSAHKVLFLIDEAAALAKITRFPNWLATLRRYNVVIWSIWQNLGQVKQLYAANWEGVIANCGLLQVLGIADVETAEYSEKTLGRTTVTSTSTGARGEKSTSETARSLLTADELTRLKPEKMIVRIAGLDPLVLYKTPYWRQPALRGRFHANPYRFDKNTGPGIASGLLGRWAHIYYALVCLMAPHPAVAIAVTLTTIMAGLLWLGSS